MSCRHRYGRSGAENGPGQGQTQTRTEASVQAWATELSAHRALGKGSVEPTTEDAKWEQGYSICWWSPGNKIPFFLSLTHHYSSFGPLAQISFSQGSPQTPLSQHEADLYPLNGCISRTQHSTVCGPLSALKASYWEEGKMNKGHKREQRARGRIGGEIRGWCTQNFTLFQVPFLRTCRKTCKYKWA